MTIRCNRSKAQDSDLLVGSDYELAAKAAGELPQGFDPADHHNARFHPRTLQMAIDGGYPGILQVLNGKLLPMQLNPMRSGLFLQWF